MRLRRRSQARSSTAAGGLNPNDFLATNPLVIGTPPPPVNANLTGTVVNNQAATPVPITTNTLLSGATGTDSLTPGFTAGDSIVVDGVTINFKSAGASGNDVNVTDSVGVLLGKISNITGGAAGI